MPFEKRHPIDDLTERINGCALTVSMRLGCGFVEKVYENALRCEMVAKGLRVGQQVPYRVTYGGSVVGEYVADLVVEDAVVVEVKACGGIDPIHKAQSINYLKASGLGVALLYNFGRPRLEIRRVVRTTSVDAHPPLTAPSHRLTK